MTAPDPLALAREIKERHQPGEEIDEGRLCTDPGCAQVHPCDAYRAAEELERVVGDFAAFRETAAELDRHRHAMIQRAEALAGEVERLKAKELAYYGEAQKGWTRARIAEASLEASLLRERGLREALEKWRGADSPADCTACAVLDAFLPTPPAPTTGEGKGVSPLADALRVVQTQLEEAPCNAEHVGTIAWIHSRLAGLPK